MYFINKIERLIILKKFIILTLVFLGLDQLTKHLALTNLAYGGTKQVIGDFFRFTLAKNPGGVFGTRIGGSHVYIIFACLGIVLIFVYVYNSLKQKNSKAITGLGLIMSGAFGNLIDRFRFGMVTDFLDFGIGKHRWATFNIADSAILIGLGLLLIAEWKNETSSKSSLELPENETGSLSDTSGRPTIEIKDSETD